MKKKYKFSDHLLANHISYTSENIRKNKRESLLVPVLMVVSAFIFLAWALST